MSFKPFDPHKKLPQLEEEILNYWNTENIFEKSIEIRKDNPEYSFYDGPPFATGTPHYGHLVGSIMKDTVPRYWTMRGYKVRRKWGWDCHGLPIENIAEKELGIKRKKEIEELGVDKFNEVCRSKVLGYVEEWKKVINRIGRWADMEHSYKTMDADYMETIWWVFKELWNRDLVYEGYRSMHICPRCETTLSQSEVAEGYKMVKDLSVTVKFPLIDEPDVKVLAWTTTPWTLIGNVALAVGADIDYVLIKIKNEDASEEKLILAKTRLADVLKENTDYEILKEFKGQELAGKAYQPLFDDYWQSNIANKENGWKIYTAGFVTTEDGTGVVHIAPAFGEDDMNLGKEKNLPFVQHVGMDGTIKPEVSIFAGLDVKPKEDPQQTDVVVMKNIAEKNRLFAKEKFEHSYPHCWRCDTPLLNYATSSWFVNVTKIKNELLENAKGINWIPKHIKEGRFGNWLEGARDWSISRQRYWASAIPIWKCACGEIKVIGSIQELKELSGEEVTDLHKHVVDKVSFPCEKCGQTMHRIPDVLDCWFESGSMPYAQLHYPFENQEKFANNFPAKFIAEGVDQTRAWFYYLHLIATAIKDNKAFDNVIVNGIVLAEDGKKMSKRLQNYPDPSEIMEKYGADPLRMYLLSSPVMAAENINFMEKEIAELSRGTFRMLLNTYSFFIMYANIDNWQPQAELKLNNFLDKWIISELNLLIKNINQHMESYELNKAMRLVNPFVDNLSNWYIRRSRRRFWKSENDGDKNEAYQTLYTVLVELAKLIAPFTPFLAEEIYRNLTGEKDSVHLQSYPQSKEDLIDKQLSEQMAIVRKAVELGLSARAKAKIKVRQPLNTLEISGGQLLEGQEQLQDLIKDEVNVKDISLVEKISDGDWEKMEGNGLAVALDKNISEELHLEGISREIVRYIQEARKKAGLQISDHIRLGIVSDDELVKKALDIHKEYIIKETLANEMIDTELENALLREENKIDQAGIVISLVKE